MNKKILFLFLALNLFVLEQFLFPNLTDINAWDEASYVYSGRILLDAGRWPNVANNPFVATFYALTYLPVHSSPFWLVQSDTLGRFFIIVLLCLSTYLVSREIGSLLTPRRSIEIPAMGILLVTPVAATMLRFPSDPIYAALAALSFWLLLVYYRTRQTKHLWLSSALIGLAALARNDGLLAFFILLGLVVILVIQSRSWKVAWQGILAVIVPFGLIVGGYVLFYGLRTGDFRLGTTERTYLNFEVGQEAIYKGTGNLDQTTEARLEAQRVFGTAAENNNSVFKAIQRNPGVYFKRLVATLRALPDNLMGAYGIRFAPILLLLAVRGVIELVLQKRYLLTAMLLLWPATLVSGFLITLFRAGHLQIPFYILFALASVGLLAVLHGIDNRREFYSWVGLLLGLIIYGLVENKLAIYYSAAIFLIALVIIRIFFKPVASSPAGFAIPLLIIFSAGLILRGELPSPKLRILNASPDERAVIYLASRLEPGTHIAAGTPAPVWMAKMEFANIIAPDAPTYKSPADFVSWMKSQQIQAVYVDHSLTSPNPGLWALLEPEIGTSLERVYSDENGDIQILLIR